MTTKDRLVEIARRGRDGIAEIPYVLSVAKETKDRYLLGICLHCFRTALQDSQAAITQEVVRFLGELLRDRTYRRIRRRVVITAIWIGRASYLILPELLNIFRKPGSRCVLAPAREAVITVAWESLTAEAEERAAGIRALEQLNSLGLLNLRSFLSSKYCNADNRSEVEEAVKRLERRLPADVVRRLSY